MPRRVPAALQVLVAVPDSKTARKISEALLAARLCACAQTLGPLTSRYTWRGKQETAREWLLLLKTRRALFDAVAREVRRLHPYEVPEIAGMPLDPVEPSYLQWLVSTTAPARPRKTRRR